MATYDGAHGKLSDRSQKYHKRKLSNLQRDSKSGTDWLIRASPTGPQLCLMCLSHCHGLAIRSQAHVARWKWSSSGKSDKCNLLESHETDVEETSAAIGNHQCHSGWCDCNSIILTMSSFAGINFHHGKGTSPAVVSHT